MRHSDHLARSRFVQFTLLAVLVSLLSGQAAYAAQSTEDTGIVSAAWTVSPAIQSARFGASAASAGDVNGDGYSDVIVGAPGYAFGAAGKKGRACVYLGSASGLSTTEAWTIESNQVGAIFGHSVSTAGDVNGDGYSDVIVGAPWFEHGETQKGRACVFFGSPSGLGTEAGWIVESNQAEAEFGYSVSSAGDVNGDGFDDVIIGGPARSINAGNSGVGSAWVYLGSQDGLGTTPAWIASPNQVDAYFGYSVSSAGDVNADGYADVIVGAPQYDNPEIDEGRSFVYHGSAAGLSTSPDWTTESDLTNGQHGTKVAEVGDVNGDGYDDVITEGRYFKGIQPEGWLHTVYHGSGIGLERSGAWTSKSDEGAIVRSALSGAGDVNGDGYSDVIIGLPDYRTNGSRAYMYHGSPGGLKDWDAWYVEGQPAQEGDRFGYSASGAGDVDGDGYSDVIVGAYSYDPNYSTSNAGRASVYHGAPDPATSYCTAGTSSSGCTAQITGSGTASATAVTGFLLRTWKIEGWRSGVQFFATNGRQANAWGNGTSLQCVVPPVKRAGIQPGIGTVSSCDGMFSQDLNAHWTANPAHNPGAGAVVQAQAWFRDPANTSNQKTGLSNAIEFVVGP